ncbi:MAG: hypothetical protein Q8L48_01360 [Archangium sp.]|nr:hypothetical protein [Archangium sp.]
MSCIARVFVFSVFVVMFSTCGASSGPDAGAPPVGCGAEGAACSLGTTEGLCRGGACVGCVDVVDDTACRAVYGARHYCFEGSCTEASCRVDADCVPGMRCTATHACEAVTCTAPAATDGTVNGTSSVTIGSGSTASWSCNTGFTLTGTAPRCEATGQLSGPVPTCVAVTCQASAPTNGTVNGGTTPVTLTFNTSATWACDPGFRLVGTPPSCAATGMLTGAAPTCQPVTCSVTAPANGTVNGGTTAVTLAFNATATWACEPGWVLQGTAPSCVGTGMLSGPAPTCRASACSDTIDGDGDGRLGFPTDPGCANAADDDETDDCPSGPNCPACSNGLDDDGDSRIDHPADVGCLSASGASELGQCTSADAIASISVNQVGASFVGTADDVTLSCGANGRDAVFRYFVTAPLSSLRADTLGSVSRTAVAFRASSCGGADLVCGSGNLGVDSQATLSTVAPGEYFILVDDLGATSSTFNLNLSGVYAAGASCAVSSTLRCAEGSVCTGTCVVAACNDTIDADGDGLAGYPGDPGCASLSDNDETDDCPAGPGCPACSNGLDDDTDGLTDYPTDPGCVAASAPSELSPCASVDPVPAFVANQPRTFAGAANDLDLSCGADGLDQVFRVQVRLPLASLSADTVGSVTPAAVAIRTTTCSTADLVCAVANVGANSRASLTAVAPGEYFIVVDDLGSSSPGAFTLNVTGTYALGARCDLNFACDASVCLGAAGAETCVVAACGDQIDADGDGFAGYPQDPGCASLSDNDESDDCPSGPGCPACSNDLDDDSDGLIDYPLDPSCAAASSTSEL